MATNTAVELDLPEAAYLADLIGIEYDLRKTMEFADRLGSVYSNNRFDPVMAEALTTAILITYARSFVTGVRKCLPEPEILEFSEELKGKHATFKAIRDKHIAHSVNSFEESVPLARYWIERVETEGITSIGHTHSRLLPLSGSDLDALIELTDKWLQFVSTRILKEKERLLAFVRAMPLEDILSQGWRAFDPGREAVDKPRKRLGQKRKPGGSAR